MQHDGELSDAIAVRVALQQVAIVQPCLDQFAGPMGELVSSQPESVEQPEVPTHRGAGRIGIVLQLLKEAACHPEDRGIGQQVQGQLGLGELVHRLPAIRGDTRLVAALGDDQALVRQGMLGNPRQQKPVGLAAVLWKG